MTTVDGHAIELSGLSKTFGRRVRALRGVDLTVRRGEVFGLLGPNGAGKSTLLKILMTVIRRSGGRGTLLGRPIGTKSALRGVGYLPEHHRFPSYLTGRQLVDYSGSLAGIGRGERRRRTESLLEMVGMKDWATTRLRQYSKGMKQRVGLAQALVNDPAIVLLDEPTDGVDPVGRREIRDICARLRDEGRTVFINSHLLSELEMVCDRLAILVKGEVDRQGTLDELVAGQIRYDIELAVEPDKAGAFFDLVAPGERLESGETIERTGSTLRLGTTEPDVVQPILRGLVERGATVRAVRPSRPSLEDLFIQAVTDPTTGRTLGPGARTRQEEKPARAGEGARS
ncbi:MAG: ABC transporter ATP-binding protein [Planctomycetota bacterium]